MANKKLFPVDFFGTATQEQEKYTPNPTGKDHPKLLNPLITQKKNYNVIQEIKEENNEESTDFSLASKFGLKITVPDSSNDESVKPSTPSPILFQGNNFFPKKNIENKKIIHTCKNKNTINIIFSNKNNKNEEEDDKFKITPHFNYYDEINKKNLKRPKTPKLSYHSNTNEQKDNFAQFKFIDTDKKTDKSFTTDDLSNIDKKLEKESNNKFSTAYNTKTYSQKKEKNHVSNFPQCTITENNIKSKNIINNFSKKNGNNIHDNNCNNAEKIENYSRKTKRAKTSRDCNITKENHNSNNNKFYNNNNENRKNIKNNNFNNEKKVSRPNSVAQTKKINYNINKVNNDNSSDKKNCIKDNDNNDIYLPLIFNINDGINKKNIVQMKLKKELKNIFNNMNDNFFKDPEINNKIQLIMKNLKDIKDIQEISNKKKSPLKPVQKQRKNNKVNMMDKK